MAGKRLRRRRAPRLAGCLTALVSAIALVACSSATSSRVSWARLDERAFVAASGSQRLHVGTLLAGDSTHPWLVGGQTETTAAVSHVAIWSAGSAGGPWRRAGMAAVPGRDGPEELIIGLARRADKAVAFGSRSSPQEGYPRPSTWSTRDNGQSWQEALADRELFGGPFIVGLGGITAGPHGFSIAGTWSHPGGHAVAAVWQSTDGTGWHRNDNDPSFAGTGGEIPLANDVADGSRGLLLVGTAEVPTPAHPTYQRGAIWYSPSGRTWTRLFQNDPSLAGPGRTVLTSVQDLGSSWIVGGAKIEPDGDHPYVWLLSDSRRLKRVSLPLPAGHHHASVSAITVSKRAVFATGIADGAPAVWEAPITHGVVRQWRSLPAPAAAPLPFIRGVVVVADSHQMLLVVSSDSDSQLWTARY